MAVDAQVGGDRLPVFPFDHPHEHAPRTLVDLLGGKGAGLAEMTATLGLPVPPGFTIAMPVSRSYRAMGWPDGLDEAIAEECRHLEARMGRQMGDPSDPLLVAVRSGAPQSMPGMLDTVLNLGLTEEGVAGLEAVSGDAAFAWDTYRRFLRMYACTVRNLHGEDLPSAVEASQAKDPTALRSEALAVRELVERSSGPIPTDPRAQLREAVEAVFRSWDCDRAQAYRQHEHIPDDIGTAVNVQAMVFGNRGTTSGTGVVFTRNPSTGEPRPYGDFLQCAQGEDVVAGSAATLPIDALQSVLPEVWDELTDVLARLERHYRDICDVEFTVEDGRLWLLQTRVAKRSAVAAVRTAVAMIDDPDVAWSVEEAMGRVPPATLARARADVLAGAGSASATDGDGPMAKGLGASPGRVHGKAVFSAEAALDAPDSEPVILVRPETSPDDVAGMSVSVGILTARGGLVSHAAVVARGWGITAVVGAAALHITRDGAEAEGGARIAPGDVITIDGTTGEIWLGRHELEETDVKDDDEVIAAELPELRRLEQLASGRPVTTS